MRQDDREHLPAFFAGINRAGGGRQAEVVWL